MDLTCPKCHGTMRTYERNGVHVDQCTDCRGIFLDRGELDRLIDAENDWHGSDAPHRSAEHQRPDERHSEQRYPEQRYPEHSEHDRSRSQQGMASGAGLSGVMGEVLRQVQGSSHSSGHSSGHYKKRKKESFLGELFG